MTLQPSEVALFVESRSPDPPVGHLMAGMLAPCPRALKGMDTIQEYVKRVSFRMHETTLTRRFLKKAYKLKNVVQNNKYVRKMKKNLCINQFT